MPIFQELDIGCTSNLTALLLGKSQENLKSYGVFAVLRRASVAVEVPEILPSTLRGVAQVDVSAEAFAPGDSSTPASRVAAVPVKLSTIRSPEVELSKLKQSDGPFPIAYESFHYYALPNARDLTCSVIKTLGDKFDFL